jgi:hypothetical protein
MFDAELGQGPADLRGSILVDRAAGLGREEVVAAAIGVERAEQAMLGHHLAQRHEAAHRPLLLDQEGRVDLAGGVVHRHDQIEATVDGGYPLMR